MDKKLFSFSISNSLFDLAYNVGKIFSFLFFYQIFGNSLAYAIGGWVAVIFLHTFFVLISSQFMGKIGIRVSLIIATMLFFFSFLAIIFMDRSNPFPYYVAWIILYAMARSVYYIPFHLYMIHLTKSASRGEQTSKVLAIAVLLSLFVPLIGGTISSTFGLQGIAVFSAIVFLMSIIPLFNIPNYKFTFSGRLWQIFKAPPNQKEFKLLVANDLQNKEHFWQIYCFIILGGSFLNFGILFSIINVLSFGILWVSGRFLDHRNLKKVLHIDAIITTLVWIFRMFVYNPITIAIADTCYSLVSTSRNQVTSSIDYQLITHENTMQLLDERLVAKEVYWNLFAGTLTLISLLLAIFIDIKIVFVIAAIGSLLLLAF